MKVCANINKTEHMTEICHCPMTLGWEWNIVLRANVEYRIKHIVIKCDYPYKTKQSAEKALVNFAVKHNFNIDVLDYGKVTKK